jgi:hypothetical protein
LQVQNQTIKTTADGVQLSVSNSAAYDVQLKDPTLRFPFEWQPIEPQPGRAAQPRSAAGDDTSMEFQARGGVIEGIIPSAATGKPRNFYARCACWSYSKAKDQLILEGDGKSDAELYLRYGESNSLSFIKAQKIVFFQKTGEVSVNGLGSVQIKELPAKPVPAPAPNRH